MDVDEGEATPVRADIKGRGLPGDNFRETEHLVLGHVLAADGGEEAAPSPGRGGSRLRQTAAENGVYPLSQSAAAACISCARVAIPVSWSMRAKPPSAASMPVMRWTLPVQAAGSRHRRSVSWTDWSGGSTPLRRFQERIQRASSAVSFWSQKFPYRGCRRACWSSQVSLVSWGHGGWGFRTQGGPQGGQGGQSRGDGPLIGCTADSRGRSGRLFFVPRGRPVAGCLGRGGAGSLCPPLEDVGGRVLVFSWAAACTVCHAGCSSITPLV